MTVGFNRKLGFGIFQSLVLGILTSVPILYSFLIDGLQLIGQLLLRASMILGGTDMNEVLTRMILLNNGLKVDVKQGSVVRGIQGDAKEDDKPSDEEEVK